MNKWYQKRWGQNLILVGVGALGVYALIYLDVLSRARESYQEAEKYMLWNQNPQEKRMYFDAHLAKEIEVLNKKRKKEKISVEEYKQKVDILEFDHAFNLKESSLKYAYQWYKDTYELFSPPESKWVRMAREKAPQALAQWKQELDEKGIPYEDYMFE